MPGPESQPVAEPVSLLEKTKKFALKILGIAVLAGLAYVGLKSISEWLKKIKP